MSENYFRSLSLVLFLSRRGWGEGGVSFVAAMENGFIAGKCEAFNQAVCVRGCLYGAHFTSPERG